MFAVEEFVSALVQLMPLMALMYLIIEITRVVTLWLEQLIEKDISQQKQIADLKQEKLDDAERKLAVATSELRKLRAKSPAGRQARAPSGDDQ
jgi:hypothetical protein